MAEIRLLLGDCLERMTEIGDGSVDLIACDLPYGTTACKWDSVIPFEPMWAQFKRVLKGRGAVVLTATQPFTSALVMSNPKWFRYQWIWDRCGKVSGHLDAHWRPLRRHESILVFSEGRTTYNPLKTKAAKVKATSSIPILSSPLRSGIAFRTPYESDERFPVDILAIPSIDSRKRLHPTQKPVPLFEYLIRTYSNEGETVLDCTMGSGTTGVACVNTGRKFIGIERDPGYYAIAERRIAEARTATPIFAEAL